MEDILDNFTYANFLHTIVSRKDLKRLRSILGSLTDENIESIVQYMCIYDWTGGLRYMLGTICLNQQQYSHGLTTACMYGRMEIIDMFLRFTHYTIPQTLLELVCKATPPAHLTTWYTIVCRLLEDPRINPAVNDSAALSMATLNKYTTVVDRLLQDTRVDPTAPFRHGMLDKWNIAVRARLMEESAVFWRYSELAERTYWYALRADNMQTLKNEIVLAVNMAVVNKNVKAQYP